MTANCLSRQRLVGDVFESFGDLSGILSLPGGDEVDGMMNVGWGKLGRMTTKGLLEGGSVLGAKSGYSTGVYASRGRDMIGRMTRIKQREDVVDLTRG